MKLYTVASINKGAGVFDHVMRSAKEYPSSHKEMPTEVAIGVIAAAIKSGLSDLEITSVFDGYFDKKTVATLKQARLMYTGPDSRFHLWQYKGEGKSALHWNVGYYANPDWMISPHVDWDD